MLRKEVVLKVDGIDIVGRFYLPDGRPPHPAVCVCHGVPAGLPVPGDRGYAVLAERVCSLGFAVFLFNFRGTGASGGNLDLLGWSRDLKAAIDYLYTAPEVDRPRLTLLGFSGGAAVSIYVAAQDKRVSSVIACACPAEFNFLGKGNAVDSLISHFRSIGIIRDEGFPDSIEEWLSGFRQVSPIKWVAQIFPRPLVLVHGSQDDVVDVSHTHRLYRAAGEPKQIIIVDGAGHRLRLAEKAMAIVLDLLKALVFKQVTN